VYRNLYVSSVRGHSVCGGQRDGGRGSYVNLICSAGGLQECVLKIVVKHSVLAGL